MQGTRDNLTDSDSGCVSPGSRIKDSASPELKRMDSGYKSPHAPSSPCNPRRHLTPHDDFKEDFAKAQFLADILDRNSETTSDSLKSNPVKDHLEQMILNAASAEDRSCLEQVQMLLYNFQALSSSVSEDECFQVCRYYAYKLFYKKNRCYLLCIFVKFLKAVFCMSKNCWQILLLLFILKFYHIIKMFYFHNPRQNHEEYAT